MLFLYISFLLLLQTSGNHWSVLCHYSFFFLKVLFIYLFLERGGGREKERERNISVWLPLMHPPTGGLACNPGMCPNRESKPRFFGSKAGAQSTEPHRPREGHYSLSFSLWSLFFQNLKEDYFLKSHFRFTAKLKERYRDFPYIPCLHSPTPPNSVDICDNW